VVVGDGATLSNRPYARMSGGDGIFTVVLRAWNDSNPLGVSNTIQIQVQPQVSTLCGGNNPAAAFPYDTWSNAAARIQTPSMPVSRLVAGVVSNGVYDTVEEL